MTSRYRVVKQVIATQDCYIVASSPEEAIRLVAEGASCETSKPLEEEDTFYPSNWDVYDELDRECQDITRSELEELD